MVAIAELAAAVVALFQMASGAVRVVETGWSIINAVLRLLGL